jgi:hypothetical protein
VSEVDVELPRQGRVAAPSGGVGNLVLASAIICHFVVWSVVAVPLSHANASATLARHRREHCRLVKEQYAVSGDLVVAARAFLMAYGANAFTALRKLGSSDYGGYTDAVRLLLHANTIRFGAFFGSVAGVFRLTELEATAPAQRRPSRTPASSVIFVGLVDDVDA